MAALRRLLTTRMRDTLAKYCSDLMTDEKTKVDQVAIRVQDIRSTDRLVLVVKNFDPIELGGWSDLTQGQRAPDQNTGMRLPPGTIGGDTFEQIRGIVELNANLTKSRETVDEADEIIQEVLARAKAALRGAWWKGLKDDYGEIVVAFRVIGGAELDSGAKTANTTHYFLRWVAFTYAPSGVLEKPGD